MVIRHVLTVFYNLKRTDEEELPDTQQKETIS